MPESGGTPGTDAGRDGPLTRYVRDYLSREGLSERALAARSRDPITRQVLKHGWINELVGGRLEQAPKLFRLRALAAGMGVPERRLAELAAEQWLEVQVADVPAGDDAVMTVTMPPGVPGEERERFRRMMQAAADQMGT